VIRPAYSCRSKNGASHRMNLGTPPIHGNVGRFGSHSRVSGGDHSDLCAALQIAVMGHESKVCSFGSLCSRPRRDRILQGRTIPGPHHWTVDGSAAREFSRLYCKDYTGEALDIHWAHSPLDQRCNLGSTVSPVGLELRVRRLDILTDESHLAKWTLRILTTSSQIGTHF
jgi:hypothetical protein